MARQTEAVVDKRRVNARAAPTTNDDSKQFMMHSDEDGNSSDYEEVKDSDLPPDESEATVDA